MASLRSVRTSSRRLLGTMQQCHCHPVSICIAAIRLPSRHLSLWPKFLKPNQSLSKEQKHLKESEEGLAQALEAANRERQAKLHAKYQVAWNELRAWNEHYPISTEPAPPFKDPLGHLTFAEQEQFFANPPETYIATLEERAIVREAFEKELFLADPISHWETCYSVKPDFGTDTLPEWIPWSNERRKEVMEKYRRYDKRFQNGIRSIYEAYDSPAFRADSRKKMLKRVDKERKQRAIFVKKSKNKNEVESLDAFKEVPLAVVDTRVYRVTMKFRNDALIQLWHRHNRLVSVFEDIDEAGLVRTEQQEQNAVDLIEKWDESVEKREEMQSKWKTMSTDAKVAQVNWSAINSEM